MDGEPPYPWSIGSSAAYSVAAWVIARSGPTAPDVVMAVALTVLAVGSAWFHLSGDGTFGQEIDHAGMDATFAALAVYAVGGPWWIMAVAAVGAALALEVILDRRNRVFVGTCLALAAIATAAGGAVLTVLAALAVMGGSFAIWHLRTDRAHAVWHVGTAVGLYLLWTGVSP